MCRSDVTPHASKLVDEEYQKLFCAAAVVVDSVAGNGVRMDAKKLIPRDVLDKLMWDALVTRMIGSPHYRLVEEAQRTGGDLPARCKPGALLEKLTEAEREALKGLTSDVTRNERPYWK